MLVLVVHVFFKTVVTGTVCETQGKICKIYAEFFNENTCTPTQPG